MTDANALHTQPAFPSHTAQHEHSTLCPLRTPRPHAARQIDKQSEKKKKKQRQHGKVECRKQAALGSTGRDDGSGGAVEKKREHHGQKAHRYLPTSSIAAYSMFFDNMRFMVEGELARLMARLLRSEPRDSKTDAERRSIIVNVGCRLRCCV